MIFMFKIMTKLMSADELIILNTLWEQMVYGMGKYCIHDCDNCKRKRLCKGLNKTREYLETKLNEINADNA